MKKFGMLMMVVAAMVVWGGIGQADTIGTVYVGAQKFGEEVSSDLDGAYARALSISGTAHVTVDYLPSGQMVAGRDGLVLTIKTDFSNFDVINNMGVSGIIDLAVLSSNKVAILYGSNKIGILNDATVDTDAFDATATYTGVGNFVSIARISGDNFAVATDGGYLGTESASSLDGMLTTTNSGYGVNINDIAVKANVLAAAINEAETADLAFEDITNLDGAWDGSTYNVGSAEKTSVAFLGPGDVVLSRKDGVLQIQDKNTWGTVIDSADYGVEINDVAVYSTELMHQWNIDEGEGEPATALNDSANYYDGTLNGAVAWQASGPPHNGTSSTSLLFGGATGDYVSLGDIDVKNITIALWAKASGDHTGMIMISKHGNGTYGGGGSSYELGFGTVGNDRKIFWRVYADSQVFAYGDYTATDFDDGRWHHFAATYDGATQKVYVDGALSGAGAANTGPIINSTTPLFLGMRPYSAPSDVPFDGYIGGKLLIYNTALSAEEIFDLTGIPTGTVIVVR